MALKLELGVCMRGFFTFIKRIKLPCDHNYTENHNYIATCNKCGDMQDVLFKWVNKKGKIVKDMPKPEDQKEIVYGRGYES